MTGLVAFVIHCLSYNRNQICHMLMFSKFHLSQQFWHIYEVM